MSGPGRPGPDEGGAGAGALLAVDTAELVRVRARLEEVAADLAAAGARTAGADAMALGHRRLVTAVERVQQDWGTHVRALRGLADVAAQDLGAAAAAYDACEAGATARVGAADLAAPASSVLPPGEGAPSPGPTPTPSPQPAPTAPPGRP